MKKVTKKIAKKAMGVALAGTSLGVKVKEEVDKKMNSYKKRIAYLAFELGFFVLGFNFVMLGLSGYLSQYFPQDLVFLVIGTILIIAGLIIKKRLKKLI